MKRRTRRHNQWKKGYARPHHRERTAVYPLARRTTQPIADPAVRGFDATIEYQVPEHDRAERGSFRDQPRGVRLAAWLMLAIVPLVMLAWVGSVVIPIAWEARQAAGKVFVTPVARVSFVTPVTTTPVVPGDTPTSGPSSGPNGAAVTATTLPGEPTPTSPAPTPTALPEWSGREPINILLLGVDTRVGDVGPPRSDTIIIVRVDPVAGRVDMLSIPRDLLVEIPGYYATKINAAYPFGELDESIPGGGPTLTAQTIELNFQIPIHYFAEVDIAGMEKVIDTIGGVMIDVPGIVTDDQYPTEDSGFTRVRFTPGLQMMDGVAAVRYARTRHDGGDFSRQARQQQVLLAIRERALATGLITNLPNMISELGDSIRTDILGDDPSLRKLYSLARLGQEIGRENIFSHTLGPYVYEEFIDDGYYLVGDWDVIRELAADLPSDPNGRNGFEAPETVETPSEPIDVGE